MRTNKSSWLITQLIFWSYWYSLITLPGEFFLSTSSSAMLSAMTEIFTGYLVPTWVWIPLNILFSLGTLWFCQSYASLHGIALHRWWRLILTRILYWLSGNLPCRIISDGGVPYLERYYLCTIFGVRFCLHRFVGSDPDRGLHDHPWPWARSVVLSGYYFEQRQNSQRCIRYTNSIKGYDFHRVILDKDTEGRSKECWTLFFHSHQYVKKWGFLRPSKKDPSLMTWVPWNFVDGDPSKDGSATSGEWWRSAPLGKYCNNRQPISVFGL